MQNTVRKIAFDELVPGASVRVIDGTPPLLSAVDVVMMVTGKDVNYAGQQLREAISGKFFSQEKIMTKALPGKGNSKTKMVTYQSAIELIMVLPGSMAKEVRRKAAEIITRYFGGDMSLVDELEANAASTAPINAMARASLGKRGPGEEELMLERSVRIKRLQLENLELEEKTQALRVSTQVQTLALQRDLMDAYERLCPNQTMDDRARARFRDTMMNLAMQNNRMPAITQNGEPSGGSSTLQQSPEAKALGVGELADSLGIRLAHGDSCRIGVKVKAWYRNEYNDAEPLSAPRPIYGRETRVAVYCEKDWKAIEGIIREHVAAPARAAPRK